MATEGGAPASFVDTQPNPNGGETADSGDRQGGRRRNRRGGRGRDRDEVNGTEVSRDAQAANDGEATTAHPQAPDAPAVEGNGAEPHVETGDATIEDAGNPSDTRGEGSGNRRRRGGRGRDRGPREGAAEGDANEGAARDAAASVASAVETAHGSAEPPMASADSEPEFAPLAHDLPAVPRPFLETREEPASVPQEQTHAHEAPRPAAVEAVAAAPEPDYVLPIDSLLAVADGAGLQWVNSDGAKIKAAQEAMAAVPAPIRTPRDIRKVESVDAGPLVLVETKKDLSQVRLPFETQTPGS
jgi:ribonuclease E